MDEQINQMELVLSTAPKYTEVQMHSMGLSMPLFDLYINCSSLISWLSVQWQFLKCPGLVKNALKFTSGPAFVSAAA